MLLVLLLACSNVSPPAFGGGGHRYTSGDAGGGTGGGDDTADTGDTGDTGYELEEGAPELGEVTLLMETGSDSVTYVLGEVEYSDDQNDIAGGDLFIDLTTTSTSDALTLDVASSSSSEGDFAYASGGAVVFYVEGLNPELEYLFALQLRDEAGHLSNVVTDSVGPIE